MNGVMRKIVVLIGVLSLLTIPLVASADDGTEEAPPPSGDSQLVYYYDGFFQLFYGFFAPDGDPEACTPSETVVDEGTAPDPETVAGDGEPIPAPADECSQLLIESSNGEVNHGSFLSSFVKAFKAASEGDTPFGHYVREFAQSDLGKTDKADKAEKPDKAEKGSDDGEDADVGDDDDADSGKPDKTANGNKGNSNGHGKGKKGD